MSLKDNILLSNVSKFFELPNASVNDEEWVDYSRRTNVVAKVLFDKNDEKKITTIQYLYGGDIYELIHIVNKDGSEIVEKHVKNFVMYSFKLAGI